MPFDAVELIVGLLGGLALFLYGMQKLAQGLKAAAGGGLKRLLARLTVNRVAAAGTGALVTAVIQSSSVTTVLVVGFVTAGVMSLPQAVGVIMGANIGTTVTAQIVAFEVTEQAWLMVAAGFALWSLARVDRSREYGAMLMGLGLLFLGMGQMSAATEPLRSYTPFIELMQRMRNPALAAVVGMGFTALVQSSSATTGIVIVLAAQGFLSLEGGIALAIGANVGTCVTALLAALGKPADAVRAAVVHVLFNLTGALLWLGLIPQLAAATRAISPAAPELEGLARLAAETPRQIANANTLFNLVNTMLLLPLAGPIARLATRLVRDAAEPEAGRPRFLDPSVLATPALALDRARLEVGRMGEEVVRMLERVPAVVSGSHADVDALVAIDRAVDALHRAVLDYLRKVGRRELSTDETRRQAALLAAANHLEATGDLIETSLAELARKRIDRGVAISPDTARLLDSLAEAVAGAMRDSVKALVNEDVDLAQEVTRRKADVHGLTDQATTRLAHRLLSDDPDRLEAFRIESDLVGTLKRLFYNARQVARTVPAIRP